MWWGERQTTHQLRIRDASQDHQPEIQSSPVREDFQRMKGRPTTTADFWSPLWQIHHVSNVCLLEDKIQDWGVYLFTISYGSYAVDQRSGDGWISGWFWIFVFCKKNSNAKFWSTRCEDLLRHWTKSSIIPSFKRRISPEEQKAPEAGPFSSPSRQTDCLLDLRSIPGHWNPWFCRKLQWPVHYCPSKWCYSGKRFQVGRNSVVHDKKSRMMTSWKDCTN